MSKQNKEQLFSVIQNLEQLSLLKQENVQAVYLQNTSLYIVLRKQQSICVRTYNIETYQQISTHTLERENKQIGTLISYKIVNGSQFFISTNPFSIEMCFKDTKKLVTINFEQEELPYNGFSCHIEYPNILIFGGEFKDKNVSNNLIQINMYTFQLINIKMSYSPIPRINHCSHFSGNRLYIFGGYNQKYENINDNLLWTYDTQKGCWFGLQLIGPKQHFDCLSFKITQLKEGKLILINLSNSKIYSLNLYQSTYELQKSKQQDLKQLSLLSKCINKQNRYQCPLLGKIPKKLLIFDKYQTMIEYQIQNQVLC